MADLRRKTSISPKERAEDKRLVDIAERTNSVYGGSTGDSLKKMLEKALLVKELVKGGGMFPTEEPTTAQNLQRGQQHWAGAVGKAPPGYEAKEVMVNRGGKSFKSTRYVKVGGQAPKYGNEKQKQALADALAKPDKKPKAEPAVVGVAALKNKLKQVWSDDFNVRQLQYPVLPALEDPQYREKLGVAVDAMPAVPVGELLPIFEIMGWNDEFNPTRTAKAVAGADSNAVVKVGREYSAVLYIKTNNPDAMKAAMKRAKADEVDGDDMKFVPKGYIRAWWD